MKQFAGFPARMEFTPVPNLFLNTVVPDIDDVAELKTTLYVITVLYNKKGHIRFVTRGEMETNAVFMKSLKSEGKSATEALRQALAQAVTRCTLLHLAMDRNGVPEDVYFLNTEANRNNIANVESGELVLEGMAIREAVQEELEELPDIFTLYEQNIGALTPMIAEELREALKQYPEEWLRDAIKEAVSLNKRNWRYIERILERWSAEGRGDGTHRQHPSWKTDPDKYVKGPYGHLVQR